MTSVASFPAGCRTLDIPDDGRVLRVAVGGAQLRITAEVLWVSCPSAVGRRRRMDNPGLAAPVGLRIVRADTIGRYGVNIAFSDGHDRGIYPWSLLETLARRPSVDDFIISAVIEAQTDHPKRRET